MLYRDVLVIETTTGTSLYDITGGIELVIQKSKIGEGLCNIFLSGTTAGILINEHEHLLVEDFKRFYKYMADDEKLYSHPANAMSHLRASVVGNEKTIPVAGGKLLLGQWQRVMLWEFDVTARKREIVVTIIG